MGTVLSALITMEGWSVSLAKNGCKWAFRSARPTFVVPTKYCWFPSMDTTTVCFDLVSLFDLGWESLITFGFARVDTMRKNKSNMNKISFSGPVWTSPSSLCLFRKFKLFIFENYLVGSCNISINSALATSILLVVLSICEFR
jgi:hypothetical protein